MDATRIGFAVLPPCREIHGVSLGPHMEWKPKGRSIMSRLSWLQKFYWTHFGKPVEERALISQLIQHPIGSVLEIGVGDGQRMQRIAKLVQLTPGAESLRYIGTDEFESAPGGRHLSLKQAHQLATQLGFKASLIPGDACSAIPRVAHKMGACDMVIIDGGLDPSQPLSGPIGAWLNRLAHASSIVLASQDCGGTLSLVDLQQLDLPSRVAA